MTALALTAARISPIFPRHAEIYPFVAVETITAGQVVYITSAGKAGVADANASGKQQARGIALCGASAGGAVDVLKSGHVEGFTITQAYDAQLFLSDTAGSVDDAAGTMTVPIGRVIPMSDVGTLTKVAYFEFEWNVQRS